MRAELPAPAPVDADGPASLELAELGAVVYTCGFRPDYAAWIDCPGAFDELGFPLHRDGESVAADGLYFVGVHFLPTRKSSLLVGVGEDAALVAERIAVRYHSTP